MKDDVFSFLAIDPVEGEHAEERRIDPVAGRPPTGHSDHLEGEPRKGAFVAPCDRDSLPKTMGVQAPPEALLAGFAEEYVLVLEVIGADRARATQGNPPLVSFRVVEVLRGDFAVGGEVSAIWPSFDDPFYAMRNGPEEHARWQAAPLEVPMLGERWVATGSRFLPASSAGPVGPSQATDGQPPAVLPAHNGLVLLDASRLRDTPEARARIDELLING